MTSAVLAGGPSTAETLEEAQGRRDLIASENNPLLSLDYVATLKGEIPASDGTDGTRITIRYVPDKLVFDDSSWAAYLAAVALVGPGLETVAATVIADLNNELVPRWVHVEIADDDAAESTGHGVVMEDRQPNWDNPGLLRRLAPF